MPTAATRAPYRVVTNSGPWECCIRTLQGALASWRSAARTGLDAAIYDAQDQRIDPADGRPGIEVE